MSVEPDVLERAREGDEDSFNQVVLACQGKVLGMAYRLVGKPDDVDDVAQEVFVRLHRSLPRLRDVRLFDRWLYRLTVNATYDYLRKKKRRRDTLLDDLHEEQVHTLSAGAAWRAYSLEQRQSEAAELARRILGEVSPADRILLTLREVEGLSLSELEGIYDANANAIKVRLFRARKRALEAYERLQEADRLRRKSAELEFATAQAVAA